jgi:hypothetical protein
MNSFSRLLLPALLLAAALATAAHAAEQNAKEMVTAFYRMVFYDHKVADAFKTYVGASYRQHNPLVPDGIEPSVAFLSKRFETNPRRSTRSSASSPMAILSPCMCIRARAMPTGAAPSSTFSASRTARLSNIGM